MGSPPLSRARTPGEPWPTIAVAALGLGVLFLPPVKMGPLRRWHAIALGAAFFLCLLLLRETSLNLRQSEFIYFRF